MLNFYNFMPWRGVTLAHSLPFSAISRAQCDSGTVVFDQCRRRCKCVNGKLVSCCRVRTPFTEMSVEDRARYIQVIKKASTDSRFKRRYEDLLTVHKTIFRTGRL